MQTIRADLHIHSRHSRATSKQLTPRNLAAWAKVKGLHVLGTGDATHPGWIAELQDALEMDEASGLYRLKNGRNLGRELPFLAGYEPGGQVRFMLQAEISSIYKRGGKVRKVHNLVYLPDFETAQRLNAKLDAIGNITSDGRPILGLDARDLLEMVLELDERAVLVPAHIWTPWFSIFGSKSGFDSVEECFGDLARHVFAMETGLSSDPEMNRLVSRLDGYRMLSNSDAHSGEKLGREANLFSGELSYEGLWRAVKGEGLGSRLLGTIEFFPEEGKYHLDGHRKCGVVLEPSETVTRKGLCPVCGKPLTVGVLHRVMELADRETPVYPVNEPGFVSLVPLQEILSEVVGTGPRTKKVMAAYAKCVVRFGSELAVLQEAPLEDLARVLTPLAEGVDRMRRGQVRKRPGYDGEFGVIEVFTEAERKDFRSGGAFSLTGLRRAVDREPETQGFKAQDLRPQESEAQESESGPPVADCPAPHPGRTEQPSLGPEPARAAGLNPEQALAAAAGLEPKAPVLVLAGPGTGKTHTLMARVAALLDAGVRARHILVLTFTRRAAGELTSRLADRFGERQSLPRADTLHALAHEYWAGAHEETPVVLDEAAAKRVFQEATGLDKAEAVTAFEALALARERMETPSGDLAAHAHAYAKQKESWNLADYTDLLEFWLERLAEGIYACPFTHVLVDEVQDLSPLQLELVRRLVPPDGAGFFGIGDPDQAIYGFRGAAPESGGRLAAFWPGLELVELRRNYRSAQRVLDLAARLVPDKPLLEAVGPLAASGSLKLFEAPTAASEAAWIGERLRELIGATSHTLADGDQAAGARDCGLAGALAPGDVAVLVRLKSLVAPIKKTLDRLGLPVAAPVAEAFWNEPRVARILAAAAAFLGVAEDPEHETLACPDKVLAQGPAGVAAYLEDVPPFDRLFWTGRDFRALVAAYGQHGGWAGLVSWLAQQNELEAVRQRSERVQVMTLHAAKGLEFRAVFLPALEEGLLPFAGPGFLSGASARPTADVEEERRLLYVGLTRAKEALYLSHAARRRIYGREHRLTPSRFLSLLGPENLGRSTLVAHTERSERQLPLL